MNEEELKQLEKQLKEKEGEINQKENELKTREEKLATREADASNIAKTLKEEFDKKLDAQKQEFEERLKQRDEVIKQLASGDTAVVEEGPIAELNKRRLAQKAA